MSAPIDRSARFTLDVSLSFKTTDGEIGGHTLNVSESGVLAQLDEPVELWMVGELALTVGEYYIEIDARVARALEGGYGFSFLIRDDNDRLAVRILTDYAISITAGIAMRLSYSKWRLSSPSPPE